MNKQEALNFIKKNTWAVASGPAVYQFCYPFMAGFMRMSKYYNEFYKSVFLIITNQVCYQYSIETQTFKNIKQLYDEPEKTKTLFNNWRKENKRFFEFCEKEVCALEKLDDNKLYLLYNSFLNYFIETWTPTLSVDVMGTYTETELLNNFLKAVKEGVKKAVNKTVNSRHLERRDTLKYFNELCQPTHISFVRKEHISILNLALLYKKEKDKFNLSNHFKNQLKEHQKNVYWIENNYRNIKTLDERYFLEKIKAESAKTKEQINESLKKLEDVKSIEKKQKLLFTQLNLKGKIIQDILLTHLLTEWQDSRREMNMKGNHYLNELLKMIAKRKNLSLNEIYHASVGEISSLFTKTKNNTLGKIDKNKLHLRSKHMVQLMEQPEQETIFEGKDAEEIINAFKSENIDADLRGGTASVSNTSDKIITGKVRVVLDANKSKLEEGEILVASMTRPEYEPLMKKAKAIITDEGGMTSHAAIVSREMGIPCIIGTKNATKLLKDGMIVAMNTNHGVVRIIKS